VNISRDFISGKMAEFKKVVSQYEELNKVIANLLFTDIGTGPDIG
jgi:hypothetical protein